MQQTPFRKSSKMKDYLSLKIQIKCAVVWVKDIFIAVVFLEVQNKT